MIATWRAEYAKLVRDLTSALSESKISIVVTGGGWKEHRLEFDGRVEARGPITGRGYVELLRSSKIVIAPMTMQPTLLHSIAVPPEQETTRTFQLAAAHCFFVHQRTDRIAQLYDESNEVPQWSDAGELAGIIRTYLPQAAERTRLAANAHRRAVPAYSYDARASELVAALKRRMEI